LVTDKPKRKQVQLRLARLALEGTHADMLPFWLGVTAFGGTFTAPLCREVRDKRGWSYVAQADFDRRSTLAAPVILRTAPALGDALDCLMLEIDLYRSLARGELEDQAVDFARSYLCNRDPLERASATQLLSAALKNEALGLAIENLFATPARLEALPIAEVTAAMSRHLDPDSMTVVMVADAGDVAEKLRDRCNAQIDITDYRDGLDLDA
jgi:zinc protease